MDWIIKCDTYSKLEIEKSINTISSLSRNGDKLVYVVKEFREDERMVIGTEIYSQWNIAAYELRIHVSFFYWGSKINTKRVLS
jgi:hypothetical protein